LAVGDPGVLGKIVEAFFKGAVREDQAQEFDFTRGVDCVQSADSGHVGHIVQLAAAYGFVTGAV
jgi:hypothetical protein